jgi:hypothetical protein
MYEYACVNMGFGKLPLILEFVSLVINRCILVSWMSYTESEWVARGIPSFVCQAVYNSKLGFPCLLCAV